MALPVTLALVVLAYLVGTVPTAQMVAGRRGVDPTAAGSGNPGASNVYRLAGRRAGVAVLVVDVLKGLVPTAAALAVGSRGLAVAVGVAAVLGHVLPVTRGFRGGKGVATAGGAALVLWPVTSAALVVIFVVLARTVGTASVGSLVMAAGLPVGVALVGGPAWEVAAATGTAALVIVRHASNIRRLVRGEERRTRHHHTVPHTIPPTPGVTTR
ncbi:MAG: glycerol-3-phosphate acyltransferase [Acidimicrobiia bacterium]|nr:glycerol-3-phosphate acyltransferase [Acidimicrobiia bacterium]